MATAKKPTSASKQKTAPARKMVRPTGQAMDIIPKNRVRPSTTSRPVITTSIPVADNTMTTPGSAPALEIKRRRITIAPPADSELIGQDVLDDIATGDSAESEPTAATNEQGVSVAELIAKRKDKASGNESTTGDILPGTTPELPGDVIDDAYELEPEPEDAASEAARLLADEPGNTVADSTVESTVEATDEAVEIEPALEFETDNTERDDAEPAEGIDEPVKEPEVPKAETAKDTPFGDTKTSKVPGSGSESHGSDAIADILKDDTPEPQEHSQALKDELKKSNDESDKSELYGGKPVIVVHKEHGPMSALAWVLWFFLCLALAVLAVNFLLDAGFIETNYQIPHTNIL